MNHEIIQCLGCENIQFRNRIWHEDMYEYTDEGPVAYDESIYYPRNLSNHVPLKNLLELSDKLRIVYLETIKALTNNCYLLAGVGLRTIIEAICKDQNIIVKDLLSKINKLVSKNLITKLEGDRLHSIRFLGNDAAHEMAVPKEKKLRVALDIIEQLIKNLYLIDIEASEHLDTIISEYEEFKNLVLMKFRASKINRGDEKNMKEILGKDFRRIEPNYISNFTNTLVGEIQNDLIKAISVGKNENNQQYFKKN